MTAIVLGVLYVALGTIFGISSISDTTVYAGNPFEDFVRGLVELLGGEFVSRPETWFNSPGPPIQPLRSSTMPTWLVTLLVNEALRFITPETVKKLEDAAKAFVVAELKKFAASTPSTIDDKVVEAVASALGVPA